MIGASWPGLPQFTDRHHPADGALDLMGDVGEQAGLGFGSALGADLPGLGAVRQAIPLFQQSRDQHDRQIAKQDQQLGHHGPVGALEGDPIGAEAAHASADRQDRDDNETRSHAQHSQADGDQEQQRHGDEADRHRLLRKDGEAQRSQKADQDDRLDGLGRRAEAHDLAPGQGQAEAGKHSDAEGVAKPPGLGDIKEAGALHPPQHATHEQGRRYGRYHGGAEQEAAGALHRGQVQRGREAARQQDGDIDVQHVGDGEHRRQLGQLPASKLPAATPTATRAPNDRSYKGPRVVRSQTATARPPAPQRAATTPAERAKVMASTTKIITAIAVKTGARGGPTPLVGRVRARGAAGVVTPGAGSKGSSARLICIFGPETKALCSFLMPLLPNIP